MNDLHIDFSDNYQISKVRQRFFTCIGIALCIVGLLTILFDKLGFRQILTLSCNLIAGLVLIIQVNPKIFKWTKCFINISNTDIEYKFWGIQRKTNVKWDLVKSVSMNFNEIYIDLKTQKTIKLNLEFISDRTIRKIKQSLLEIGNEKGIEISEKND